MKAACPVLGLVNLELTSDLAEMFFEVEFLEPMLVAVSDLSDGRRFCDLDPVSLGDLLLSCRPISSRFAWSLISYWVFIYRFVTLIVVISFCVTAANPPFLLL